MRHLLLGVLLWQLLFASPAAVKADPPIADPQPQETDDLCAPDYQLTHPAACPTFGPGAFAARSRQFDLPPNLTPLATLPLQPLTPLLSHTYAKVTTPDTPVFASADDGANGKVLRTLGKGYIYVSINNIVEPNKP